MPNSATLGMSCNFYGCYGYPSSCETRSQSWNVVHAQPAQLGELCKQETAVSGFCSLRISQQRADRQVLWR